MDLPPEPSDDALAQPTRARLFALLVDWRRPATTDELAGKLGLHPNGVRAHLVRLEGAKLVARTQRRPPRGRPYDEWSVAPDAKPGGDPPRGYADLARWLALASPVGQRRRREVEAVGREIGRELAPGDGESAEATIGAALSALGFQPELATDGGRLSCVLDNCPYRDAARENPELVCTLHRGITRGLLDVIEPDAELVAFVPRDPDLAGCLIEVDGLP
jgi:predicted ArsR family transcriptional regulator